MASVLNTTKWIIIAGISLPILLTQAAHASQALDDAHNKYHSACDADMRRFCAGAEHGKKGQCLKDHLTEVSSECKHARKEYKALSIFSPAYRRLRK